MSFDIERVRKSANRITKFLGKNSKKPSTDSIHNLRTDIRSLETAFVTLGLHSKRKVSRLLLDLGKVRKRAGKVRDMDVLKENVIGITQNGEKDCILKLMGYLGAQRNKHAKKLRGALQRSGKKLEVGLDRDFHRMEKLIERKPSDSTNSEATQLAMTKAAHLSSALHQPARLTQNNLHPYRLKVKELRDVLLLSNPHGNKGFLDELGAIKDAIGEWHDSEELVEIAMESLDHGPTCKLIEHLRAERGSRLEHALSLIRRLRKKHPRRSEEEGARRARSSKPDVSLG